MMNERTLILLTLLLGAAVTDLKEGKIYNLWLLPGFAAGIGWLLWYSGPPFFPKICETAALQLCTLLVLFPLFAMKQMGAGDIKLLLTLALYFPREAYMRGIAATFIAALPVCLYVVIKKRKIGNKIPFAVPIALGFSLVLTGLI